MQRALQPVAPPSADRDDQGVVGKDAAAGKSDAPVLGVDACQRVYVQLGALLVGDLGEIEEVGLGEIKGRRHREWLVDELAVRGNQVHLHPDLQKRAQRQQRLDRPRRRRHR